MFWEIFIPCLIVFIVVILLQVAAEKAEERKAKSLVKRLDCPSCGMRSLDWQRGMWYANTLYRNVEKPLSAPFSESSQGFVFHCSLCNGEFQFTDKGHLVEDKAEWEVVESFERIESSNEQKQ